MAAAQKESRPLPKSHVIKCGNQSLVIWQARTGFAAAADIYVERILCSATRSKRDGEIILGCAATNWVARELQKKPLCLKRKKAKGNSAEFRPETPDAGC